MIAVLSFLGGCVGSFGFPAFQTTLPDLVPRDDLVAAVGLSNAQWNLGRIIGPALAALVMGIGGIGAALWCNAISFAAVIVAVAIVRLPQRESSRRPIFAALGDGVRFARGHPAMRRMLALMIATMFIAAPFIAFVSQMATNIFDGDSSATSFLVTAQGVGAVTAAFTLGGLTKRIGVWRLMTGAVLLLGPVLVLYAASPRLWVAAICLAFIGLLYGYSFTSFAGVAQQSAPDEMRGRVLAVNTLRARPDVPGGHSRAGRDRRRRRPALGHRRQRRRPAGDRPRPVGPPPPPHRPTTRPGHRPNLTVRATTRSERDGSHQGFGVTRARGRRPRRCCRRGRGRRRRSSSGGTRATARGSCSTSAPDATAASKNARTAARSGALNAMCDSRKPSPLACGPIQKSGIGGTPNPMTAPKSMTRPPPSGASTAS